MYHRTDQHAYYKKVLAPLEIKTIKRIRRRAARIMCGHVLTKLRTELRRKKYRESLGIAAKLLKSEWRQYRAFRPDRRAISPESLCFSDRRIAVYMAVFDGYDCPQEPLFCPDNVDYFIFTDGEVPENSKWVRRSWEEFVDDPRMSGIEKNRFLKMFPHLLFPEYEYSVYVDGNVLVTADFTPLAMQTADYPVAMHIHKDWDCVYEEIDACIKKRKDTPEALSRQRTVFQQLGIPAHWGFLEATVIARRHHDPVCRKIMETWWNCFCIGCRRDQIALIRCLWELQIHPQRLGGLGTNMIANSKFIWSPHKRLQK